MIVKVDSLLMLLLGLLSAEAFSTDANIAAMARGRIQRQVTNLDAIGGRAIIVNAQRSFKSIKSSVSSSKDAEIAELEEKLRKLKEEQESGNVASDEVTDDQLVEITDSTVVSTDGMAENLMPEMLSESWKVDTERTSGTSLFPVLLSFAAVAILLIFAQVPVGQDELKQYAGNIKETSSSIDLGDMNPIKSVKDIVYTAPEE